MPTTKCPCRQASGSTPPSGVRPGSGPETPLTVGELHREFTANPGKWMILNREVFNKILDAAVKAGDIAIQTPTGEIIGDHHLGLHHANDFVVWLPQYAPKPDPGPRSGSQTLTPQPDPDPLANPNSDGHTNI